MAELYLTTRQHAAWLREEIHAAMKVLEEVTEAEGAKPPPAAFLIGYLMGAAQMPPSERDEINATLYGVTATAQDEDRNDYHED